MNRTHETESIRGSWSTELLSMTMGTYNNICPRPPTNYSHQPPWQQHAEPLNGLISLHKLAPSLISPLPNVRYALKHHMLTLPIHNHYLRAADSGAKKRVREAEKKNGGGVIKTLWNAKRGGENKRCGSISDSPLALSYQSHWLAHVILLWFGLANQCAADSLPVTVQPLDKRWKIP